MPRSRSLHRASRALLLGLMLLLGGVAHATTNPPTSSAPPQAAPAGSNAPLARVPAAPVSSTETPPWTERYQTLMSAAVGFAGIIITLLVNGGLARRQAREAEMRERHALRRALRAELGVVHQSFLDGAKTAKDAQSDGSRSMLVPTTSITAIYDASHAKLGLLDGPGIGVLVSTYALVKELPAKLGVLCQNSGLQLVPGFVNVPQARFAVVEKMLEIGAEEIDKAIKAVDADAA